MRKIYLSASVNPDLCTGDKICENICVTKAIVVSSRLAQVNENRCVNCKRCMDSCPAQAISMKQRDEVLVLKIIIDDVNADQINELCTQANLRPDEPICLCTLTTAKEVAAAVLKGAKTPDDVTLMTGARSACGMWCIAPIFRIMNAYYDDLPESDNSRWYNIKSDLWNADTEVDHKYPEYRLEEDKELFQKGIFHNLLGH